MKKIEPVFAANWRSKNLRQRCKKIKMKNLDQWNCGTAATVTLRCYVIICIDISGTIFSRPLCASLKNVRDCPVTFLN